MLITGTINSVNYLVACRPSRARMHVLSVGGDQAIPSRSSPAPIETTLKTQRVRAPIRREHPVELSTSAPTDGPSLEPVSPF
jgi:hypothetical protein